MKECIHNKNNLKESDINDISIRVKVLLINKQNIILGYERGKYQFPGGHLEENETLEEAVKREIKEETGIILNIKKIPKPFYKITSYYKDWFTIGVNQKSEIYYYVIYTNETPNLSNTNYTEYELSGNYILEEIPLTKVIQKLTDNIPNNKLNNAITPDMIKVIKEYLKERI